MTRTDREVFLFACSAAPSRIVDRNVDRIARNVRIVRLLLSFHFDVRRVSMLWQPVWLLRKADTQTSGRITNLIGCPRVQALSVTAL